MNEDRISSASKIKREHVMKRELQKANLLQRFSPLAELVRKRRCIQGLGGACKTMEAYCAVKFSEWMESHAMVVDWGKREDLNAGKNVDEATPQRYRRATPCPEICVDYCKMLAKNKNLPYP